MNNAAVAAAKIRAAAMFCTADKTTPQVLLSAVQDTAAARISFPIVLRIVLRVIYSAALDSRKSIVESRPQIKSVTITVTTGYYMA